LCRDDFTQAICVQPLPTTLEEGACESTGNASKLLKGSDFQALEGQLLWGHRWMDWMKDDEGKS